jgi:hypothetical protein
MLDCGDHLDRQPRSNRSLGTPDEPSDQPAAARLSCHRVAGKAPSIGGPMPLLLFLILVIMIAQIGFWNTFQAILGGVAMLVLFVLLAIATLAVIAALIFRRMRG